MSDIKSKQELIREIGQSVNLLTETVSWSNPKLARDLSIVLNSALTISASMVMINGGAAAMFTAGSTMCTIASVYAYVAAAMAAYQLIHWMTSQDEDDQADAMVSLFSAVKTVSIQIEELRKEMNQRFDRLEKILGSVYEGLLSELKQVQKLSRDQIVISSNIYRAKTKKCVN